MAMQFVIPVNGNRFFVALIATFFLYSSCTEGIFMNVRLFALAFMLITCTVGAGVPARNIASELSNTNRVTTSATRNNATRTTSTRAQTSNVTNSRATTTRSQNITPRITTVSSRVATTRDNSGVISRAAPATGGVKKPGILRKNRSQHVPQQQPIMYHARQPHQKQPQTHAHNHNVWPHEHVPQQQRQPICKNN